MKNIHILPTSFKVQNIYITSDEEIKEGDWFIRDGSIHKCFRVHKTDIEFLTSIDSVYCGSNTFWSKEFCKKIILTTDQDLIKDGVQEIDNEFLEWFVKNPSCEEIEVDFDVIVTRTKSLLQNQDGKTIAIPHRIHYRIIIPKEEPKQETLEEAAEKVYPNDGFKDEIWADIGEVFREKFIEGAKWQQERMYSEEDMIAFYNFIENHQLRKFGDVWKRITNNPNDKPLNFESVDDNYIIEWFEQFKKK